MHKREEKQLYINDKLQGMIKPINDNIIEVVGLPLTSNGFTMYLDNDMAVGDYKAYTTLYRTMGEQVYQYSNNGSIYVEPEPIPEPEPYVPTEEELAEIERQNKIADINSQIAILKDELSKTDYQIIKGYEFVLVGEVCDEYDYVALHEQKESYRAKVELLEEELKLV